MQHLASSVLGHDQREVQQRESTDTAMATSSARGNSRSRSPVPQIGRSSRRSRQVSVSLGDEVSNYNIDTVSSNIERVVHTVMKNLHPSPSMTSNIDNFIRLRTLRDEAVASGDSVSEQ
jgi:hypothetical protein